MDLSRPFVDNLQISAVRHERFDVCNRTSNRNACLGGGIQSRRRDPCGFGKRAGSFQRLMQATSSFQKGATACATYNTRHARQSATQRR